MAPARLWFGCRAPTNPPAGLTCRLAEGVVQGVGYRRQGTDIRCHTACDSLMHRNLWSSRGPLPHISPGEFCHFSYCPPGPPSRSPPAVEGAEVGGVDGGVWHEAMALVCLPLAAPLGLSPLHIPTLCGSERVWVVSTQPPDRHFVISGPSEPPPPAPPR